MRSSLRYWLGRLWLLATGWKVVGAPPPRGSFVAVAAPHTSNGDFLYFLAYAYVFGLDLRWMGKRELFRPPLGWLVRLTGGIPVDRGAHHDVVGQMAEALTAGERVVLALAPEGSRSRREYWKSGFYYIAVAAGVPIALAFLDYRTKRGGFGPAFLPSGDLAIDMDRIRTFYGGMTGKNPDQFAVPRLRDEAEPEGGSRGASTPVAASAPAIPVAAPARLQTVGCSPNTASPQPNATTTCT